MYSSLSGLVLGFHGCDEATGRAVIAGEMPLKSSDNDYDWLGHGIYFWESSPTRAFHFAREKKEHGDLSAPFVIGAILDLGQCLNLLDIRYAGVMRTAHELYIKSTSTPAQNKGGKDILKRDLDCAVIETLHADIETKNLKSFDSVRCAFEEGDPIYDGSGFREENHIQLCVRNPDCIKGYFLPLQPGGQPMAFAP